MDFRKNIDTYLLGELAGEERRLFKQRMDADLELAKEVAFQRRMMGGVVANAELKTRITRVVLAERRRWRRRILLLGGLFLLVLLTVGGYFFLNRQIDEKPIDKPIATIDYEQQSYSMKGSEEVLDSLKKETVAVFNNRQFERAGLLLDSLETLMPLSSQFKMMWGNCHFENDENDEALVVFETIIRNEAPNDRVRAQYFSAWAYVKQNRNLDKAKELLDEVHEYASKNDFPYQADLQKLREYLTVY